MSFTITCPSCGQMLEAENEHVGLKVNCPKCNACFIVHASADEQENDKNRKDKEKRINEIISEIKYGRYESLFYYIHTNDCSEEDILVFLLEISCREHDFNTALTYAEKLIKLNPNSSVGYRWKAEILDDGFGKMEESIRYSTKAIELNPNDTIAYTIRANTKRWLKPADNDGAIQDYNTALRIDQNCTHAYSGLGWVKLNQFYSLSDSASRQEALSLAEEAKKFFIKSLELEGEKHSNYGALQGLAAVLQIMGNSENEYLPMLNTAIKLSPRSAYLYDQRAKIKMSFEKPPVLEIIKDLAATIVYKSENENLYKKNMELLSKLLRFYCEHGDEL